MRQAADDESVSLIQFVMQQPGVDAARLLLESSKSEGRSLLLGPAGENGVIAAIETQRHDVLRFFLKHGVDANLTNPTGAYPELPLEIAVRKGDFESARMLLEHHANPNGLCYSTLPVAFFNGSPETLEMLLKYGADPRVMRPVAPAKAEIRDAQAKFRILLPHVDDLDDWVSVLFDEAARANGFADAELLWSREARGPSAYRRIPLVKTAWVENLLKAPERVSDPSLEAALREATALRDHPTRDKERRYQPCSNVPKQSASPKAESPETFISEAAHQVAARLPGYQVRPDPGMVTVLIIDPQGAKVGHVSAQFNYEACSEKDTHCSAKLFHWARAVVEAVREQQEAPELDTLRVVLTRRPNLEAELAPRAPDAPPILARPLWSDFVFAVAAERLYGPRFLDTRDLSALQLTEEQVFARALENTRSHLALTSELPLPTPAHPIQTAKGNFLEASTLLMTDRWAQLAERLGGELIATVPAANEVAYAKGGSAAAIAALGRFAAETYPVAERPVSTKVLRWAAGQWEVAKDETRR